jgi:hypothetical protein
MGVNFLWPQNRPSRTPQAQRFWVPVSSIGSWIWCRGPQLRCNEPFFSPSTCFPGWWFGTFFIFPYIGNNYPNWLIFFRGVQTTNQFLYDSVCFLQGILAQTQPCTATMAPAGSRPPSRSSQVSSDGEGDDMGRRPSSQCVTPRVEGTGRSGSPVHRANLPFSQQSSQQRDLSRYEACER